MKRSFFITLGLYLLLAGAIWKLYEPLTLSKKKSIQIANLRILKPKQCACGCERMQKPKSPPKKEPKRKVEPKQKIKSRPKIKPKTKPKTKSKRKIRAKKHKPKRVLKNKIAKHPTPKPKKVVQTPTSKPLPLTPQKTKVSHPIYPASSPSSISSKPKRSYQHLYIQRFLARIEAAIRRHTHYPRIARRTHQEGVVELCFTLQPSKEVTHLHIVRSSGHKILDRAAKKTILQAAKEFPPPKKAVDLQVPIEYRLR